MLPTCSITPLEREEWMNLRTSHLAGFIASVLVILTATSGLLSAAEPLKITGPDGEQRQMIRQYGPTTFADTFWSIAQKTRPDDSVTVYQVMAAIYEANPHAFASNNYNSLEKGMILLIPSKAVMAAIPKSLAKQLAQTNDAGWQQAKSQTAKPLPVSPQPTSPRPPKVEPAKPTLMPVSPATSTAAKSTASVVEVNQAEVPHPQLTAISAKLEAQQAKNLSLTDELARAEDKLNLAANDNQVLQDRIDQLDARVAELEEALLIQKEQKAELSNQVALLNQELTAVEPVEQVAQTGDSWRTIMSNPLYIGLAAAVPALLLLLIVALMLKRRNASTEETQANTDVSAQNAPEMAATQAIAPSNDADESVAVHLDDEADTLASLMSVDNDTLKSESDLSDDSEQLDMAQEMFIDTDSVSSDPQEEEGQSLDDLWAEAMGEQEEETFNGVIEQDDLDSLLANMDNSEPAASEAASSADETDLDAMLASFDSSAAESGNTSETSATVDAKADLDALLAEFDAPEQGNVQEDNEDLSQQIAHELEQDNDDSSFDDADLDSLLAEFDTSINAPANEESLIEEMGGDAIAPTATTLANDSLIEEVPFDADDNESVPSQEIAPTSDNNEQVEEFVVEEVASEALTTDALIEEVDFDSDKQDVAEQIAAELAEDEPIASQEADLDTLLADFGSVDNSDATAADDTEASNTELDTPLKRGSTAEPLEFESFPIDHTPSSTDEDDAIELALPSDDVSLDDLLADLESVDTKEGKTKNDSGFFDDLKGNKRVADNILEWDNAIALQGAETTTDINSLDDPLDDELSLTLDDDDNLTVDEALAALDAQQGDAKPTQAVAEHDLTAFQQDNGFIDIDRLLNEANEDLSDVDQYKELNVDMGELDDLMGSTTMVDVDDEENSVNAKLDLARAYIEIDDMDSAKALLKEVQLDGNERQQSEAKHLLSDL